MDHYSTFDLDNHVIVTTNIVGSHNTVVVIEVVKKSLVAAAIVKVTVKYKWYSLSFFHD